MVITKEGIAFTKFSTPLVRILNALVRISKFYSFDLVITDIDTVGIHAVNSKHYSMQALDVRSKNFSNRQEKLKFIDRVSVFLGEDYTILLESEGRESEHFHIQVRKGLNKS